MKVKIMTSKLGLKFLEIEINNFLMGFDTNKIVDIKIQTSDKITLAMIIYKEDF